MLPVLDTYTWTQWDQQHYLDIARSGYRAFPCLLESGFNQGDWCGNAAWFPFFPLLIRGLSLLLHKQDNEVYIGVIVSNVFFLLLLLYAMPLLSQDIGCKQKGNNILFRSLFFALFPSSIFFHSNYPLSLALCAGALSLHFIFNNKPLISIPLSFISCVTYPPMLVLTAPIGIYGLCMLSPLKIKKAKPLHLLSWSLCVATPCLSYYIAQIYIDLNTGISHSFKLVGEKYGHGLHNPINAFKSVLIRASKLNEFSSLQTVFLVLVVVSITVCYLISNHKRPYSHSYLIRPKELAMCSFMCSFLILPMVVGGAVSTYRTESLSSLAIVIMSDKYISNNTLRFLILTTAATLSTASLSLFLEGRLV